MNISKIFFIALFCFSSVSIAQQKNNQGDVFVDENGVMRWKGSNEEVALFGVNYTTPFAYSFRAQKKLGVSLKNAIDLDVTQMVRLGFNAFRVHVWDREISDKEGNLLNNEHLDLFDYLLSRLAANNIKIIITPIAWWGTGWPEPDTKAPGFSQFYSKLELVTNQKAKEAEKNYIKQFINHVNKYRELSYKDDPSIIAMEIINEPNHPANQKETTGYINEMVEAFRDAGFTKPLFYNISQNWNDTPNAQAVCNANIQGLSFQWYPTGLVHNSMLKGNYLINVNHYAIPSDSLTGYKNKAKMVYEFDAADIGGAYMYPAIVRSFREAGMQFAAMFCYDPTQIAWSNTEYGTHFMNLLYAPSKALSLMVAARAFHELPRYKSFGNYPENNNFGDFHINYDANLSEYNSDTAFYYSSSNHDNPKNINAIKHIAGCGNSIIVKYDGTGAYFLDKIQNGIWKLEVYPDVLWIRDPFEPTSMSRQVARLFWNERYMNLSIADLGTDFNIESICTSNNLYLKGIQSDFRIKPGIYLLFSKSVAQNKVEKYSSEKVKFLDGIYSPPANLPSVYVLNKTSQYSFNSNLPDFKFQIAADSAVIDPILYVRRIGWRRFEKDTLIHNGGFDYSIKTFSKNFESGIYEYCVSVIVNGKQLTFPGKILGTPDNWDFYADKFWRIKIIPEGESIVLYEPLRDSKKLVFPFWRPSMKFFVDYKTGTDSEKDALSVKIIYNGKNQFPFGMQLNVSELLKPFDNNLNLYKYIVLRVRSFSNPNPKININFLTFNGRSYRATAELKNGWQNIKIPVSSFKPGSSLILPFSYPHFLAKVWNPADSGQNDKMDLNNLDFMQIIYPEINEEKSEENFEIESVILEK